MSKSIDSQKFCATCDEPFPATKEYFYGDSRTSDGLQCQCKICNELKKKVSRTIKKAITPNKEELKIEAYKVHDRFKMLTEMISNRMMKDAVKTVVSNTEVAYIQGRREAFNEVIELISVVSQLK